MASAPFWKSPVGAIGNSLGSLQQTTLNRTDRTQADHNWGYTPPQACWLQGHVGAPPLILPAKAESMARVNGGGLEHVPEELVVDLVVILDFRWFDEGAEVAGAAVRGSFLQVGVAALDVLAEQLGSPLCLLEVLEGGIDVVRQVAFGLAQILDFGGVAINAGFEDGIQSEIRVGIGRHGTNFDAHALFVADGNADHRTAIHRRSLDLVGGLKVRVEAAESIHAGIQNQADVIAVGQDAIHEGPAELAELLFALGIPEEVLAVLGDGHVGVHAAAIDADDRFWQEARGETHFVGHLAADQFVKLDLVGGGNHFAVSIVNFELRGRHFRVILFVLETHGAFHFRGRVDKTTQRIAGE